MCMCVCVHVCVRIYTYTHTYTHTRTHTLTHTHAHTHKHKHTLAHTRAHAHTHAQAHAYAHRTQPTTHIAILLIHIISSQKGLTGTKTCDLECLVETERERDAWKAQIEHLLHFDLSHTTLTQSVAHVS